MWDFYCVYFLSAILDVVYVITLHKVFPPPPDKQQNIYLDY